MCHHIVYCQKWLYKNLSLKILYDGTSPISIENEKSFIMVQYGDYSHTSSIIIITNYYFSCGTLLSAFHYDYKESRAESEWTVVH